MDTDVSPDARQRLPPGKWRVLQRGLLDHKDEFTTRSHFNVFATTWNVSGAHVALESKQVQDTLGGLLEEAKTQSADIVAVGLQGLASARERTGVSSSSADSGVSGPDGSAVAAPWVKVLTTKLREKDEDFELVVSRSLVGLALVVYVRKSFVLPLLVPSFTGGGSLGLLPGPSEGGAGAEEKGPPAYVPSSVAALAHRGDERGAVGVRIKIHSLSVSFVNVMLEDGEGPECQRNRAAQLKTILTKLPFISQGSIPHREEGVSQHDVSIVIGDFSLRLDVSSAAALFPSVSPSTAKRGEAREREDPVVRKVDAFCRALRLVRSGASGLTVLSRSDEGASMRGFLLRHLGVAFRLQEGELSFPPSFRVAFESALFKGGTAASGPSSAAANFALTFKKPTRRASFADDDEILGGDDEKTRRTRGGSTTAAATTGGRQSSMFNNVKYHGERHKIVMARSALLNLRHFSSAALSQASSPEEKSRRQSRRSAQREGDRDKTVRTRRMMRLATTTVRAADPDSFTADDRNYISRLPLPCWRSRVFFKVKPRPERDRDKTAWGHAAASVSSGGGMTSMARGGGVTSTGLHSGTDPSFAFAPDVSPDGTRWMRVDSDESGVPPARLAAGWRVQSPEGGGGGALSVGANPFGVDSRFGASAQGGGGRGREATCVLRRYGVFAKCAPASEHLPVSALMSLRVETLDPVLLAETKNRLEKQLRAVPLDEHAELRIEPSNRLVTPPEGARLLCDTPQLLSFRVRNAGEVAGAFAVLRLDSKGRLSEALGAEKAEVARGGGSGRVGGAGARGVVPPLALGHGGLPRVPESVQSERGGTGLCVDAEGGPFGSADIDFSFGGEDTFGDRSRGTPGDKQTPAMRAALLRGCFSHREGGESVGGRGIAPVPSPLVARVVTESLDRWLHVDPDCTSKFLEPGEDSEVRLCVLVEDAVPPSEGRGERTAQAVVVIRSLDSGRDLYVTVRCVLAPSFLRTPLTLLLSRGEHPCRPPESLLPSPEASLSLSQGGGSNELSPPAVDVGGLQSPVQSLKGKRLPPLPKEVWWLCTFLFRKLESFRLRLVVRSDKLSAAKSLKLPSPVRRGEKTEREEESPAGGPTGPMLDLPIPSRQQQQQQSAAQEAGGSSSIEALEETEREFDLPLMLDASLLSDELLCSHAGEGIGGGGGSSHPGLSVSWVAAVEGGYARALANAAVECGRVGGGQLDETNSGIVVGSADREGEKGVGFHDEDGWRVPSVSGLRREMEACREAVDVGDEIEDDCSFLSAFMVLDQWLALLPVPLVPREFIENAAPEGGDDVHIFCRAVLLSVPSAARNVLMCVLSLLREMLEVFHLQEERRRQQRDCMEGGEEERQRRRGKRWSGSDTVGDEKCSEGGTSAGSPKEERSEEDEDVEEEERLVEMAEKLALWGRRRMMWDSLGSDGVNFVFHFLEMWD
uniref:Inositol polyphosphate-related phosphatase domain-containing protein n=1 Tax=Chromera velia CCMP2878 TaxID=1169474 RepID=A0A0G4I3L3_9ALVE|eukprot:Cvel_10700.t1-p1 / transcript=Cvel_10700.t1 / gene=Cvel_10700 / organism=Chromera_velia_CCMP2878 / gene_product=hypothetical protein / transcript_product=hypothetical protein / location=Cvel_scaffold651:7119-17432(+) / protein_length=1436 / sequence_SO=supercontig / SO=protein_coding / is_pseudo=false